jgi:hypothetical protein
MQNYYFESLFSHYLPQYGSLIDMNLSYTPLKEDETKKTHPEHGKGMFKTEKV